MALEQEFTEKGVKKVQTDKLELLSMMLLQCYCYVFVFISSPTIIWFWFSMCDTICICIWIFAKLMCRFGKRVYRKRNQED
jgi:hypothetical protein